MTTQLRLVDPPEPSQPRARKGAKAATATTSSSRAGRRPGTRQGAVVTRRARGGRRAASWGEWQLDARTRQVGRAGVAEARRALEAAIEQELSRAS